MGLFPQQVFFQKVSQYVSPQQVYHTVEENSAGLSPEKVSPLAVDSP